MKIFYTLLPYQLKRLFVVGETVFFAGFVQICEVYAHSHFSVLFGTVDGN